MPSQAADTESTEAYIASGSFSDHLENREIYHRESKDDSSNKAQKRPMSIKEFNERNRQLQTKEGKRTPAGKVFYYKKSNLILFKIVDIFFSPFFSSNQF